MKCNFAKERFELANTWLKKIEEIYFQPDNIIESYVEYFLIVCRSIPEYIIMDYLNAIAPKMKIIIKSEIIRCKKDHIKGTQIQHQENDKILKFLCEHSTKICDFEKDLKIKYFVTLRNLSVHSIMPTIFTNEYDKSNQVTKRRFERDFVFPLAWSNGDRIILEDGSGVLISEDSGEDSIFDEFHLNNLSHNEKQQLEFILINTEAIELLREHLCKFKNLISDFESNY